MALAFHSKAAVRRSLVHFAAGKVAAAASGLTVLLATARLVPAERLRVFRSCPLITPKRARSSLQMLAIAGAMAALCASIGHVLARCSGTLEKLSASEAFGACVVLMAVTDREAHA